MEVAVVKSMSKIKGLGKFLSVLLKVAVNK